MSQAEGPSRGPPSAGGAADSATRGLRFGRCDEHRPGLSPGGRRTGPFKARARSRPDVSGAGAPGQPQPRRPQLRRPGAWGSAGTRPGGPRGAAGSRGARGGGYGVCRVLGVGYWGARAGGGLG